VPSPIPPRDRRVFFVGAGLSSAFRLPNTPALINTTLDFAKTPAGSWLASEDVPDRLEKAFRFFYPDAVNQGFQPDVVDFFSALRAYLDVCAGLAGTGFADAADLYRLLKRAIAYLLVQRTRAIDADDLGDWCEAGAWSDSGPRGSALRAGPGQLTSRPRPG
jgi:hypothetical protein